MVNIFIQGLGSGADNYRKTMNLLSPFTVSTISPLMGPISPVESSDLNAVLGGKKFWIWGCTPGTMQSKWDKMQPGDYMIFYDHDKCRSISRIIRKQHDPVLAKNLWGTVGTSSMTWEHVYFLVDLEEPPLTKAEVNRAIGYDPTYRAQGIAPVNQKNIQDIIRRCGSVDALFDSLLGRAQSQRSRQAAEEEEARKSIDQTIGNNPSPSVIDAEIKKQEVSNNQNPARDSPRVTRNTSYPRNAMLAELIKMKQGYFCRVCASSFDREDGGKYCETHHILPLAKGGKDLEMNIVVVCPTCHRQFHYGKADDINLMASKAGFTGNQSALLKEFLKLRGASVDASDD